MSLDYMSVLKSIDILYFIDNLFQFNNRILHWLSKSLNLVYLISKVIILKSDTFLNLFELIARCNWLSLLINIISNDLIQFNIFLVHDFIITL